MASFNGQSFRIRGNGTTFAAWDARELIVLRQPMAANQQFIVLGADVQRIAIVARVTQAELFALYDEVLQSGSLVLSFETHDAFLEKIDPAARVVSGVDQYEATLHLIRL